jgi:hypothetical protein
VYAAFRLTPLVPIAHVVIGGVASLLVYVLVLRFVHRAAWRGILADGSAVLGRRR